MWIGNRISVRMIGLIIDGCMSTRLEPLPKEVPTTRLHGLVVVCLDPYRLRRTTLPTYVIFH